MDRLRRTAAHLVVAPPPSPPRATVAAATEAGRGSWEALRSRLLAVDCAALCDGSGKEARVVHTVRPLRPDAQEGRMVGRALTCKLAPGDFLAVLVALQVAEPGDVLMIDCGWGDDPSPPWPVCGGMFGELVAAEAERKGLAGLVIDGNCRDTQLTASFSIPIYMRGTHPNAGTANKLPASGEPVGEVVTMGGVSVAPGDIVLGDRDGVVVATLAELEAWLPAAEGIIATEAPMLQAIRGGESLIDMTNLTEHVKAVRNGSPTKFGFTV
jgi:regulator of RNase E activity RraA